MGSQHLLQELVLWLHPSGAELRSRHLGGDGSLWTGLSLTILPSHPHPTELNAGGFGQRLLRKSPACPSLRNPTCPEPQGGPGPTAAGFGGCTGLGIGSKGAETQRERHTQDPALRGRLLCCPGPPSTHCCIQPERPGVQA